MPFALTNDPSQSEISEAINYLLANFGPNLAADPNNGQISGPSGVIIAYLYKYIAVKYADSFDGSVNFSNTPTNRLYYGLRNSNDSVESTNPADYIWYTATGGFGTTKFLFYQTGGGRQINFFVGTAAPNSTYLQESGSSIDLDVVTTTTAYNTAAPSIYQWTATSTPPTRPSTTSTYTWSTGTYTAPSGWTTAPTTNTTPGSYLWAITIPLVVNANTVTSTLNWPSTSYPIYAFSYNGANGSTGGNGLSALTAYQQLSQSASPPSTPANTTGPTAPAGWSLTAPSVSVGNVLYYSFGQYNSSSATISGIPAGQTQWGTPTAASIFQDIRSDNWNGTTPPTYGVPSSYGTTGYYISRSTGNCYFNNGIFRGDITGASGTFTGTVQSGSTGNRVILNESSSSYLKVYDSSGNTIYSLLGVAGLYTNSTINGASAVAAFTATNASGYSGTAITGTNNGSGHGVLGVTNDTGTTRNGVLGISAGTGTSAAAVFGSNSGSYGMYCFGQFGVSNSTVVTNLNSNYLQGYTASNFMLTGSTASDSNALGGYAASSWARIFATNSGNANAGGSGVNLLGSTSTGIVGAYVGTSGTSNIVTFTVQTTSPSDIRLKEEIADSDLGLAFVKQLRPVSYKLKADPKHQKGYGFIADEVDQLIESGSSLVYFEPDWKVGDETGFKTIHYPSYVAVLTKAIQELTAKVEELEARIR